jgi:hypothetical protein
MLRFGVLEAKPGDGVPDAIEVPVTPLPFGRSP